MKWKVRAKEYKPEPKMNDRYTKIIFLWWPFFDKPTDTWYWLETVKMEYCYHFISFGYGMGWQRWRIIHY